MRAKLVILFMVLLVAFVGAGARAIASVADEDTSHVHGNLAKGTEHRQGSAEAGKTLNPTAHNANTPRQALHEGLKGIPHKVKGSLSKAMSGVTSEILAGPPQRL
jgi:hypothetical protein